MINSRLLQEFKSNIQDNKKTVIIEDIKCTTDSCGQEVLIINTKQILKPYDEVIKNYDVINKTLEVEGHLDLDDNQNYYTNLVGFISNESIDRLKDNEVITEDDLEKYTSPISHYIEVISTTLSKEITLTFNKEYQSQPQVIITIDKEYEDLYKSYSTEFIKDDLGIKYIGVIIRFNYLKSKNSYPEIGISILGDINEEFYDGITRTEANTNIHLIKSGYYNLDIYLFEMIEMNKADIRNAQIIIEDEEGNTSEYTTDSCGKISPILKFGKYKIIYDGILREIEITENNSTFELDFTEDNTEEGDGE